MEEFKQRVDELAALMADFGLTEAEISGDNWHIAMRKTVPGSVAVSSEPVSEVQSHEDFEPEAPAVAVQAGVPVSSPMTGIYYGSPSPNAPPFVKEGEAVTAGQVVALIEAMKVFNEIVAATSGTVLKIAAESGQIVNPGDPLIFIG